MATKASPPYDLSKKKKGYDLDNWEVGDKKGAGKSAAKSVSGASGVTKRNKL
jgi:hypothetical protein